MTTPDSDKLIFVYGTLKRGFCLGHYLKGQIFLSDALSTADYTMYDCGSYPGLVKAESGGVSIHGELWRVDSRCLKLLDEVEGVAENLYQRGAIQLIQPQVTEPVQTYFYQESVNQLPVVGDTWQ
ncbi:MAG: gamma-glutamylcyclotransferase [Planctomycetaceae bacterium]|nr:gamma-glutamylcyclotransferase [Planctomycetaceae bacterium]